MSDPISEKLPHELFGDGEPPKSTKERILDHAQDLFYSRGFHAVGVDLIVSEAGLTKATFYNHFESRDSLIEEVIKWSDRRVSESFMAAVRERAGWDAKAALLAMFDVLHDWFNDPDYYGCQFLSACMAFPDPNDPIHKAAGAHYLTTADEIAGIAKSAGVTDSVGFAAQWLVLIEGAVAHRAITQDDNAARVAKATGEVLLANST